MGMLTSDLQTVLQLEREGERRLEEAEAEARQLLGTFREQAQQVRHDTERRLARQREERLSRLDQDLVERSRKMEEVFAARKADLTLKVEHNRDEAIARILAWLGGEGG